jgi:Arc/MetJ family transcription regulator
MSQFCYIMMGASIHIHAMTQGIHRTTIDLDLDAVERAKELLGTTTIRDTVDKALREVDRRAALRAFADAIRKGNLGATTPEELAKLRRNPHFP